MKDESKADRAILLPQTTYQASSKQHFISSHINMEQSKSRRKQQQKKIPKTSQFQHQFDAVTIQQDDDRLWILKPDPR